MRRRWLAEGERTGGLPEQWSRGRGEVVAAAAPHGWAQELAVCGAVSCCLTWYFCLFLVDINLYHVFVFDAI